MRKKIVAKNGNFLIFELKIKFELKEKRPRAEPSWKSFSSSSGSSQLGSESSLIVTCNRKIAKFWLLSHSPHANNQSKSHSFKAKFFCLLFEFFHRLRVSIKSPSVIAKYESYQTDCFATFYKSVLQIWRDFTKSQSSTNAWILKLVFCTIVISKYF